MALNQKNFWAKVQEQIKMLRDAQDKGTLPEQPARDIVYLISRDNMDKGMNPGTVMEVPIGVSDNAFGSAAMRIVEQTHDLATQADIDAYKARVAIQREKVIRKETERRQRHASTVIQFVGNAATGQPEQMPVAIHNK